eukprot:Skav216912  [mRNA]  locus=scaffold3288:50860:51438:+ [translate_table: standard]
MESQDGKSSKRSPDKSTPNPSSSSLGEALRRRFSVDESEMPDIPLEELRRWKATPSDKEQAEAKAGEEHHRKQKRRGQVLDPRLRKREQKEQWRVSSLEDAAKQSTGHETRFKDPVTPSPFDASESTGGIKGDKPSHILCPDGVVRPFTSTQWKQLPLAELRKRASGRLKGHTSGNRSPEVKFLDLLVTFAW